MESDADSEHDHPRHEPEFIIHAVDDDVLRRPARAPALPPMDFRPSPLAPWRLAPPDTVERIGQRFMFVAIKSFFFILIAMGAIMAIHSIKHSTGKNKDENQMPQNFVAGCSIFSAVVWLFMSYISCYDPFNE